MSRRINLSLSRHHSCSWCLTQKDRANNVCDKFSLGFSCVPRRRSQANMMICSMLRHAPLIAKNEKAGRSAHFTFGLCTDCQSRHHAFFFLPCLSRHNIFVLRLRRGVCTTLLGRSRRIISSRPSYQHAGPMACLRFSLVAVSVHVARSDPHTAD